MAIDMTQFYQVFFEESAEHLAAMESLLLGLDLGNPDAEQLNAIFRAAHSIKGSAGTFGFTDLAETTHILENLLDRIRKQELALRPEMVDAFLESGDLLRSMLEAHQGRGSVDTQAVQASCTRLRSLSEGGAVAPAKQSPAPAIAAPAPAKAPATAVQTRRAYGIEFVPTAVSAHAGGVNGLLDELRALGDLEVLSQPDAEDRGVGFWQLRLVTGAKPDTFSESIDFIADNGAWRVVEESLVEIEDEAAFGFFGDAPGAPAKEEGYGFFVPLPSPPLTDESETNDEGYGFFDPLPLANAEAPAAVDDAYGFFEPLTAPAALDAPAAPTDGDGYGFFAPPGSVTAAVAEPEPVVVPLKPAPPTAPPRSGGRPAAAVAASDSSIRVSVEKVDQLINLVGELVITQAMLLQTATQMAEAAPEQLVNGLTQLERNTRDLQESVMSIRMLPISFVFSRFPRVVRDLSGKLGKQVELKTSGETTELDKGLIERIADPLTHLIRNSLDHGIELPETRLAAGKSPVGTITLKAYHQGGNIVIEVGDDGAGLPRNKILAKARERGLPVSEQMTDQEVFSLIFEAGFSTADQVTDVSGRGVGMDVVRRNIQAMGGRVEIESMLGVGTRMTVRLPLTLAILDGMSVAVGNQTYILPLSYVIESLQPAAGDIRTLANQVRLIQVRGDFLPVVILHELFGLDSAWSDFTQGIMVVIEADGAKAALFVDALVGQHQVVIKSLEANYRRVPGISGATIMGDGHVALILDVPAIAGMARTMVQRAG
ncbi:MAG: chemotaxis protein CheA [Betaproteobacteria bacterium HGW-Betaproteobacteria-7]|jgi:two-component system chemotaxis sensor kinase CheA|nr:MAG: chemotaxis protein CheA [Betaproteobacteria bacterium HGW-Betaproteobacteria-7]